jgi:hypothetical protein
MRDNHRFWKDFYQLHIPLVVVLALCTYATYNQIGRAAEGVDRSIVYAIQWPIIGIFAVVVWNRYRKHGSLTKSFTKYWRERAERFTLEAEKQEAEQRSSAVLREVPNPETAAQKKAWDEYLADLQRADPPGGPPESR